MESIVKLYGLIVFLWCFGTACQAEPRVDESHMVTEILFTTLDTMPLLLEQYPDLQQTSSYLKFADHLYPFFQKLKNLEDEKIFRLNVLQVGDSHVQADFLPGRLRSLFQHCFGMAGRGLVFPYIQAGTHSPLDWKTDSPDDWQSRRQTFSNRTTPVGISGMSLWTYEKYFVLNARLEDRYQLDNRFDRVQVFYDKSKTTFDCVLEWNGTEGQLATFFLPGQGSSDTIGHSETFSVPYLSKSLSLKGAGKPGQQSFTLYGMSLESSESAGVLFHTAGVNGVTFYHFNRAGLFFEQLPELEPDLLIATLGTNEALQDRFEPEAIKREVTYFIDKAREQAPGLGILLITNPLVKKGDSHPNPWDITMREILLEVGSEKGVAVWDWQGFMLDTGGLEEWKSRELVYIDYIHATETAYTLLAEKLFVDLMAVYAGIKN